MPEVEDFHCTALIMDSVEDVKRCMKKSPDPSESADGCTHQGELSKKIDVSQKRLGEPLGAARVLFP